MNFLKRYFIRKRLQAVLRHEKRRHAPLFAEAKQIGILFNADNQAIEKPLASFIRQLEKEGKSVTSLTYFDSERQGAFQFPYEVFTGSEIDWLGNIRSEKANKFIEKKFDFLFCFSAQPSDVTDLLLASSAAKCRVGVCYKEGREDFFELMFIPDKGAQEEQMIQLALEYTKNICQN
ncbi:DUF6913 domain-containing protein [Rhodoflexus sp.]